LTTDKIITSELPEPHRDWRGHNFWPSAEQLGRIPALYGTEKTRARDKVVHLHYFVGGSDWWLVELDLEDRIGFGYVRLSAHPDGAEWGYVDLAELAGIFIPPGFMPGVGAATVIRPPLIVERDLGWQPRPAGEVIPGL
jgi:hypothetical protein